MDLYRYLQIMRRRWLFTAIGFLLTAGLTVAFVNEQPSVYESTATFVIRPRTMNADDDLRAIDTLTRGIEVSSTFATVARSDLIKDRAKLRLDTFTATSGMTVTSEVVTSTNILEVSVTGGDPEAVHALATAVGDETVAYVANLQRVYELQTLDAPRMPGRPVAPNRPLIIGTGIALGVGVGMVFALLAEGFAGPPSPRYLSDQLTEALRDNRSGSYRRDNGRSRRKSRTTAGNGAGAAEGKRRPSTRRSGTPSASPQE
jgi:capsular polysaccharide biosynthesis protein